MPHEAFAWMRRIKAVEREYQAVRFGMDRLLQAVRDDSAVLLGQLESRDISSASRSLEGTYIVRVFSEFETSLQCFVRDFRLRKPRATKSLIEHVGAKGRIPQLHTEEVHRVREYRNVLVHLRSSPVSSLTLRECTGFLCTFLSRVQKMW